MWLKISRFSNSKLYDIDQELLETIMDHKTDVTILSEANHDVAASKSLNCIETIFKNYRVESKPVNGTSNSRILLIINKDIEYERLKDCSCKKPIQT